MECEGTLRGISKEWAAWATWATWAIWAIWDIWAIAHIWAIWAIWARCRVRWGLVFEVQLKASTVMTEAALSYSKHVFTSLEPHRLYLYCVAAVHSQRPLLSHLLG